MKRILDDHQVPEAVRALLRAAEPPRGAEPFEVEQLLDRVSGAQAGGAGPGGSTAGGASSWAAGAAGVAAAGLVVAALVFASWSPSFEPPPPSFETPPNGPAEVPPLHARSWHAPLVLPGWLEEPGGEIDAEAREPSPSPRPRVSLERGRVAPKTAPDPIPTARTESDVVSETRAEAQLGVRPDLAEAPPKVGPPDELELVDTARSQLTAEPAAALEALARHRQIYPSGMLADERDFLTVRAALLLGRAELAREALSALRARSPSSAYLPRLEEILKVSE